MSRFTYTELTFAKPSFWEGFARVLDLGGTFDRDDMPLSISEENDAALLAAYEDYLAQASDWYAVGADLHHAIMNGAARLRDLGKQNDQFERLVTDRISTDDTSHGR